MTQLALVIDLNTCVGCHACVTSCKEWNTSGEAGPMVDCNPYGAEPTGTFFNRVQTFEAVDPTSADLLDADRLAGHPEEGLEARADRFEAALRVTVEPMLEPGEEMSGKGNVERCLVVTEPFGDLAIFRVHLHRYVGICHHRVMTNRSILGVNRLVFFLDVDRFPLPCTSRAFYRFPFMV